MKFMIHGRFRLISTRVGLLETTACRTMKIARWLRTRAKGDLRATGDSNGEKLESRSGRNVIIENPYVASRLLFARKLHSSRDQLHARLRRLK